MDLYVHRMNTVSDVRSASPLQLGAPNSKSDQFKPQCGAQKPRGLISPTHKRTEGRAPVWGSEFSIQVATLQGDSDEIAPTLNVKLWVLAVTGGSALPSFKPNLISGIFETSRSTSNLVQRT